MNKKLLNNDYGFVLITSLLMLTVLMIIGIAATNTTTIELQISGNDKFAKQNFYQAESAAMECAQRLKADLDDNGNSKSNATWLNNNAATEVDIATSAITSSLNNSKYAADFIGLSKRGSLTIGKIGVGKFDVYGICEKNGTNTAMIKVGFKKRVTIQ